MFYQINRFMDDLKSSFDLNVSFDKHYDQIILCGMGGSAISGDIVSDMCFDIPNASVRVSRYPVLPAWVDERTLVVICSYSGNTWETQAMYEDAIERNSRIIVMTSGGIIEEIAKYRGDLLICLPEGVQPRQAIGLMIGHICKILDAATGTDLEGRVQNSFDNLECFISDLCNTESNIAKDLANHLHRRIPVVYSDESISSVSLRWKTQISENSKMIAFNCLMPEFNHNEIVGWSASSNGILAPLILIHESESESVRRVTDACVKVLSNYGVYVYKVKITGDSRIECILKSVILGDFVSYHLAIKNSVNPVKVRPIKNLKNEINRVNDTKIT